MIRQRNESKKENDSLDHDNMRVSGAWQKPLHIQAFLCLVVGWGHLWRSYLMRIVVVVNQLVKACVHVGYFVPGYLVIWGIV
jgi:hypothetical protein